MTTQQSGLIVGGGVVVLSGEWLETARAAAVLTAAARRRNGLPEGRGYIALAEAITSAMSANGHSDVQDCELLQHYPQQQPSVPIPEAARQLELSERQTRRLAPNLGGKKIGGQWLLDQVAIDEHRRGQDGIA